MIAVPQGWTFGDVDAFLCCIDIFANVGGVRVLAECC